MSADLHDLLDRGTPEPRRPLDVDRVVQRARHRRRDRRQAVVVGLAVVGIVTAVGLARGGAPGDAPWSGPATRPADLADVPVRLSALADTQVAEPGFSLQVFVDSLEPATPGAYVVAHDGDEIDVLLVPAADGSFCLATWDGAGSGYSCGHRPADVLTAGVDVAGEDAHGHLLLAVVVPDGYDEAAVGRDATDADVVPVERNVAVFEWTERWPSGRLVLSGDGVPTVVRPLSQVLGRGMEGQPAVATPRS
ncbi:hypothetical protein [Aquipuribacter nitratireducens]|uniref:Uncharacterized protein n=1 Tax=Aquipuribacter nitratireducens TaxID=650104 RepID=A0ABW0GME1_9MICO